MKDSTKIVAIILLAIAICFADSAMAQTAKISTNGNYVAVTKDSSQAGAKQTGKTFTDNKGNVYPLLISAKGKLFYMRTSAKGNIYKCYLKLEG